MRRCFEYSLVLLNITRCKQGFEKKRENMNQSTGDFEVLQRSLREASAHATCPCSFWFSDRGVGSVRGSNKFSAAFECSLLALNIHRFRIDFGKGKRRRRIKWQGVSFVETQEFLLAHGVASVQFGVWIMRLGVTREEGQARVYIRVLRIVPALIRK
jgi:hypothetical protein